MMPRRDAAPDGRRVAGADEADRGPGITRGVCAEPGEAAGKRVEPTFARAENEDDDGYDPWSDRPPNPEPLFERDPWS